MREAHALYRSLGFQDRPVFDRNESSLSGLESLMLFMELRLELSDPLASIPPHGARPRDQDRPG
jgi:hypothetical protein